MRTGSRSLDKSGFLLFCPVSHVSFSFTRTFHLGEVACVLLDEGGQMTSITSSPVSIQTSSQSVPSTPPWFGQVTIIAHYLTRLGVLSEIEEGIRFARRRFGHYQEPVGRSLTALICF